jgi:tetratricopeptide (TPR) repeat protein
MLNDLAADHCSILPRDIEWLYSLSLLAETCALLGSTPVAAVLYKLLAPHAAVVAADTPEGISGSVARYLGLLAATLGRRNEAIAYFQNATAANERMIFRPWLAHTQLDYARTLLARNEAGDRARALSMLDQARTTYRTLNMHSWAEDATDLAQQFGAAHSAAR